ncbi:MAG: DNA repair protein RadA [Lachnospiraceae bacterium]|nr:DNA repair protein RadA [Lachnospiraceae bacterium]
MAKQTTIFYCKECGTEVSKWQGQCPGCKAWNTLVEAPAAPASGKKGAAAQRTGALNRPAALEQIETEEQARLSSGMPELDRVLGGGLVPGSLILVGGDPGIGKSTLLLQVCRNLAAGGSRVLYVSGEESLRQIRLRADRVGKFDGDIRFLCETDLDRIREIMEEERPQVAVIDSIQTMYREDVAAAPGSVSQVRESTLVLLSLAKGLGISIFIVGHVTKEGAVAGPRMLEHMVDAVLYFEGDSHASYRILRGVKNRFGSTNEIGVFEMSEGGLKEVPNPSEYMLSGRPQGATGSVVACSMEGTRPLLLEVQALVCRTNFGMPRRTAAGTDYNRVNLLMAVLEKRAGLHLSDCDAYVNVAGGMKISEPALDLAIVMALASSAKDLPVDEHTIVFGEVGLSGEVRAVSQTEQRVAEARKLGFTRVILPRVSLKRLSGMKGIELVGVSSVAEAMRQL